MGVEIITILRHVCDVCDTEILQSHVFTRAVWKGWVDADAERTVSVTLSSVRDFAATPDVVCKSCAAVMLRRALEEIEK